MPSDDVFLSRVTHDLRGELSTMVAGVHYLLRYEAGLGTAGRQMLERVNGAGQRLRRLLDELELSVWIEGAPAGVTLELYPCRLDLALQAAVGRLEGTLAQRRATVDLAVPADLPEVQADPELLGAALEHTLDFAVARSPGRAVQVAGALLEGAPVLRITDAGGPVEAAALERIFEPFVERDLVPRAEPGTRRRERLGLGLSVARGIAAAHGAALTAASTAAGVELTLAFPRPGCVAPPAV
jgi:K+-sensing histidine kinase KdpD